MKFLASILLLLSSLTSVSPVTPFRADDRERRAFHHITQNTLVNGDSCSATAVGPHALLTATHCELGSDDLNIDGLPAHITKKIRDGNDHTIYLVDADFTYWLQMDERKPLPNERVRSWGWPGGQPIVVYSEGEYLKNVDVGDVTAEAWLFLLPTFGGDSGAAVVDDSGKVLTVVSLGDDAAHMVGFPLAFSNAQIQAIK